MLPQQIEAFKATDASGGIYTVRVIELYCVARGDPDDEATRCVRSGVLRFIVNEEYEIERDHNDTTPIHIPGIGQLTRSTPEVRKPIP